MKNNHTFGAIVLALCLSSFLTPDNAHAWGFSVFTNLVHDVVKTAGGGVKEVGRGAVKVASKAKSKAKSAVKTASRVKDKVKHKASDAGGWAWNHTGAKAINTGKEAYNEVHSKCESSANCVQALGVFGRGYYNAKYALALADIKGSIESPEHPVNYPALPTTATKSVMDNIAPYFDFDSDSCYPATMINNHFKANPGIKPIGKITEGCQNSKFPTQSNSWFREVCSRSNNKVYCGYLFALYFQKDQYTIASSMDKNSYQKSANGQNHRHDIEHVAVWTTDGEITHVGTSAHGNMHNHPNSEVAKYNGKQPRIVYHKDGNRTHAFRLAGKNESKAENITKKWQQLNVVDWDRVSSDMRKYLTQKSYSSATLEITDTTIKTINGQKKRLSFNKLMSHYKPNSYPNFVSLKSVPKGCYKDDGQRDLTHEIQPHDKKGNKAESCVKNCFKAGFKYAGTQYGEQCFCGNSYGKYGKAKNCDKKCPGNSDEKCGGSWANSVYEIK